MTFAVFNLEISQSGSYIPHDILNWVISKMVWIKLWYWNFEKPISSKLSPKFSHIITCWVIVKKSSPKNLSADCGSTVGRQVTNTLPTANRQATNGFQKRKFVVKTHTKHDPETIIIPILTDRWYKMHSFFIFQPAKLSIFAVSDL